MRGTDLDLERTLKNLGGSRRTKTWVETLADVAVSVFALAGIAGLFWFGWNNFAPQILELPRVSYRNAVGFLLTVNILVQALGIKK